MKSSIWLWIDIILVAILAWMFIGPWLSTLNAKRYAKLLKNDEFKKGLHTAQVIDVREERSFKKKHIMGARNMPYSQFKLFISALRKDRPVYIYEDGKTLAVKVAKKLKKAGFTDLAVLKNGFSDWDGKVKTGH